MRNVVAWTKAFQTLYRRRVIPSRKYFTKEDMRTPRLGSIFCRASLYIPLPKEQPLGGQKVRRTFVKRCRFSFNVHFMDYGRLCRPRVESPFPLTYGRGVCHSFQSIKQTLFVLERARYLCHGVVDVFPRFCRLDHLFQPVIGISKSPLSRRTKVCFTS